MPVVITPLQAAVALTAALSFASTSTAQACRYALFDPGSGRMRAGDLTIDLGEADSTAKPTAWQGPISLGHPGGSSCRVDPAVSIVERPIFLDGPHLLVTTYSGSNRVVFAIDTATCQVLWRSRPFVGQVGLEDNMLHTGNRTAKLETDCVP